MLKAMITSSSVTINPKGMKKYTTDAFPHIMMTTNNPVPVKVEASDRRFCISYTASDYLGNRKFWNETHSLLELPEAGHVIYTYLMSVDLSEFNVKDFPKSEYHNTLSESEIPSEVQFMDQCAPFTNLKASQLHENYVAFCTDNRLTPKAIVQE